MGRWVQVGHLELSLDPLCSSLQIIRPIREDRFAAPAPNDTPPATGCLLGTLYIFEPVGYVMPELVMAICGNVENPEGTARPTLTCIHL